MQNLPIVSAYYDDVFLCLSSIDLSSIDLSSIDLSSIDLDNELSIEGRFFGDFFGDGPNISSCYECSVDYFDSSD